MNQNQLVDVIQDGRIGWPALALGRMLEQTITGASEKNIICIGVLFVHRPAYGPAPQPILRNMVKQATVCRHCL